jgi:hypothetical protein
MVQKGEWVNAGVGPSRLGWLRVCSKYTYKEKALGFEYTYFLGVFILLCRQGQPEDHNTVTQADYGYEKNK